jgi:hypothetical protein
MAVSQLQRRRPTEETLLANQCPTVKGPGDVEHRERAKRRKKMRRVRRKMKEVETALREGKKMNQK